VRIEGFMGANVVEKMLPWIAH